MKEPPSGSASFRKLNPHLFPSAEAPLITAASMLDKPIIRQTTKSLMNQLETDFLAELKAHGWKTILCQSVKLRLGNGVWYCPDFLTLGNQEGFLLEGWEVKGKHVWEDSIVKLKVVAGMYPFIQWRLAHRNDSGHWGYQLVRP